jgi:predicted lactoylglutathione lyase
MHFETLSMVLRQNPVTVLLRYLEYQPVFTSELGDREYSEYYYFSIPVASVKELNEIYANVDLSKIGQFKYNFRIRCK